MFVRRATQSGQIGVVIILIMVVLLAVGLSLAARSSREVVLSTQEAESTRVFNAAEAGIERALSTDFTTIQQDTTSSGPTTIPGTNSTVDYSINRVRSLETRLLEGMSARVLLSDGTAPPPANVTIYWAKETKCNDGPASIIVSIYSMNKGLANPYQVRHLAYAACNNNDDMTVVGNGTGTGPYFRGVTVPLQAIDLFMQVKTVYNDTHIRVTNTTGATLPVQGYAIRSSAVSQLGSENRVVEVNRSLPVAPSVMDYVVFSGSTVTQ